MGKDKSELKRFTVSVEKEIYDNFEALREKLGENISRSQLIRKAMQNYLIQEESIEKYGGDVAGFISMILAHEHFKPTPQYLHEHGHPSSEEHRHYSSEEHKHDHKHSNSETHSHDFSSSPVYANVQQTDLLLSNDIQHHFGDIIISMMHIHLEFEKCLEIIAVSGSFERVKALKKALQKLRSVISIELFIVDKEYKK